MGKKDDIAAYFRERIARGELKPGDRLPSDRELKHQFGVSQTTVTSAARELSAAGLIRRKPKAGTVVLGAEDGRGAAVLEPRTVYLLNMGHSDARSNPWTWFIGDQLSKGIINANIRHRIRVLENSELGEAVAGDPGPKAFLSAIPLSEAQKAVAGNSPVIVNARTVVEFSSVNAVNYDSIASAYLAVSYLIERRTRRRVAMIWGGQAYHRDCLMGYRMTLDMFHLPLEESLIVRRTGGEKEGYEGTEELLARDASFDAVYADTDLKAIGAVECLRAHGRRVPEDVSVIGSDDIPGVTAEFGLTTIKKPFVRMGAEMLRLVEERARLGGADVSSTVFYGELIVRGT